MPERESFDPTSTREPLMSVADVAAYVGVPDATVYRWNYRQEGPSYMRVGKFARYRREDVDAWLLRRVQCGNGAA